MEIEEAFSSLSTPHVVPGEMGKILTLTLKADELVRRNNQANSRLSGVADYSENSLDPQNIRSPRLSKSGSPIKQRAREFSFSPELVRTGSLKLLTERMSRLLSLEVFLLCLVKSSGFNALWRRLKFYLRMRMQCCS
jgi:hypothetical protein